MQAEHRKGSELGVAVVILNRIGASSWRVVKRMWFRERAEAEAWKQTEGWGMASVKLAGVSVGVTINDCPSGAGPEWIINRVREHLRAFGLLS